MKKLSVEEKISRIRALSEEIIGEDDLRSLLSKKKKIIAYDGFEPSGQIHIAQGLMRVQTVNALTELGIHFRFWVADWFAMLNHKLGGDLAKIRKVGEYFIEVWKACGLNTERVEFIWASEFISTHPDYWKTVMQLSTHATVNRVLRCGQIMGREESTTNPSSQILYPLMQAADIHHLEADIAQLGLDQRKVNMLARDLFPKLDLTPPIAIHHHMLLGLTAPPTDLEGMERKIAMKMSKSRPETAIFMTDSEEDVLRKFKKAYCPEKQEEDNPVLEYVKYIIFAQRNSFVIERPEKFGGNLPFSDYDSLRKAYLAGDIHPLDLKQNVAREINALLTPVRTHFSTNKRAKKLLEEISSY